jgi:hypothetical protein
VAGPIATMLAGAAVSAAAGGLIGALVSKGVPEEDAHFFAEGLRRSGVLVIVNAKNDAEADRLAAVCVYDIVIELPAQYGGPERRKAQQAYSGVDRRAAWPRLSSLRTKTRRIPGGRRVDHLCNLHDAGGREA